MRLMAGWNDVRRVHLEAQAMASAERESLDAAISNSQLQKKDEIRTLFRTIMRVEEFPPYLALHRLDNLADSNSD